MLDTDNFDEKKNKNLKIGSKKEVEFDITYLSLVGKQVEIIDSKNKLQIGTFGVLVFESANLFYILDELGNVKKFLKSGLKVKFDYKGKEIIVDCSILSGSLVSRIKKLK